MPRFFYTYHYPYRWSSGPTISTYDLETHDWIASLERAKELAIQHRVVSMGENRCDTTYGEMFEINDELEN